MSALEKAVNRLHENFAALPQSSASASATMVCSLTVGEVLDAFTLEISLHGEAKLGSYELAYDALTSAAQLVPLNSRLGKEIADAIYNLANLRFATRDDLPPPGWSKG